MGDEKDLRRSRREVRRAAWDRRAAEAKARRDADLDPDGKYRWRGLHGIDFPRPLAAGEVCVYMVVIASLFAPGAAVGARWAMTLDPTPLRLLVIVGCAFVLPVLTVRTLARWVRDSGPTFDEAPRG